MSSFFSSDGSFSLQFVIIFVVIFLILAGGVYLLRRLTGPGAGLSNRTPPRGRQPRLGIVDIYELDRQRQLILLRRDNVEHLLLVGGPTDVVVERNITRGINARLATEDSAYDEAPEPAAIVAPVPRAPEPIAQGAAPPPVFASHAAPLPPEPYRGPSFEMPVVVPASVSSATASAAFGARPLDLPPRAPQPAEAPPRREQKESALARVIRRAPPSLVNLVPAALADRVRGPDHGAEALLASPVPGPVSASVVSPPTARAIDAAILSDMARQLEEALRKPSAAVRPPLPPIPGRADPAALDVATASAVTVVPEVTAPAPEAEGFADRSAAPAVSDMGHPVDPIAAAMAAAPQDPASEVPREDAAANEAGFAAEAGSAPADPPRAPTGASEPSETVVASEAPAADPTPPAPDLTPLEEPVVHAAVADAPRVPAPSAAVTGSAPFLAQGATPPASPEPSSPEPSSAPKAASPNPFSVEEIEAEFARLLGRPLDRKP